MVDPEKITDNEFLDQLVDRLKASGHKMIFVDRGLIRFSKVVGFFFGIFVLVGITLFGVELRDASDDIKDGREQLSNILSETERILNDSKRLATESALIEEQIGEQIIAIQETLDHVEKLTKDSIRRSLMSLTNVVSLTVPKEDVNILRQFYRENIAFAEQEELPLLRIEFLRRLAALEWFDDNRSLSRILFDQAVELAHNHDQYGLAAETLMRQGYLELSNYRVERQVAIAKAKRLFNRALILFEGTNDQAAQASALRYIAEAYQLEANQQQALVFFERARKLYLGLKKTERGELIVVSTLAEINRELENDANAIDYYSESVSIAEVLHDDHRASEYALELAKLHEGKPAQRAYLCAATKYFDNAAAPKRPEKFNSKLLQIDPLFDANKACNGGKE